MTVAGAESALKAHMLLKRLMRRRWCFAACIVPRRRNRKQACVRTCGAEFPQLNRR